MHPTTGLGDPGVSTYSCVEECFSLLPFMVPCCECCAVSVLQAAGVVLCVLTTTKAVLMLKGIWLSPRLACKAGFWVTQGLLVAAASYIGHTSVSRPHCCKLCLAALRCCLQRGR